VKLVSYRHHGVRGVGKVDEVSRRIVPLDDEHGHPLVDMLALIRAGIGSVSPSVMRDPVAPVDLHLLAPIPRPPRNIFCIGKNYPQRVREDVSNDQDATVERAPSVSSKVPESVIGDGEIIEYPQGLTTQLDYAAELAVVIGRGGRGIRRADAMDHVFGYTILNDVTARHRPHDPHGFLGKSFDTFCPMGPCIVTADAVDAAALQLRCHVNGELRQQAHTGEMILDVAALIEMLSAGMTLHPGDIIATGTPGGVGAAFDPPRFLQSGDEIRIEISSIGSLSNSVF
jgi:2-keto-4-pentenoate hydratase/2-oxohepta-3-ene-1,7-dioic acid hydratase in catechol pathway